MNLHVAGPSNGGWLAVVRASAALALLLPFLSTAQAAPSPSWSFEFSNNGVWLAGSAQTVTLTLQRTIDHTLFLDSITFTPTTAGIPNARTISACGNGVVVDGTQLNAPCAGGPAGAVCTVVQCPVTVPANYPTVSGVDVSAKWKDCTKLPLIDEPSPFCGSTVSTTHSLLSIAGAAPAPSPSSTVVATPTLTPTPSSTTSAVIATTSAALPAKTTAAGTNTTPPTRATPSESASSSAAANASGTAVSGASTLNDQIDGNSSGSGRTLAVIGGVIAGLLLLGVAGAVYWRYSRQKRLAKWEDPDFGTLNNRPRPFSKGVSMMGSGSGSGGDGGGALGGGGAVGAGAAAAAASALAASHHYRARAAADEYPQRYPSPEYYLPATSTAAAYGQPSSSSPYAHPHPNYAPPPPPVAATHGHYDSTAPPFMSPQNINQIQQQGGGLTRYSTNKSMGLHVVNWQEGRNTEPAPLSYPDP
ncbi:hypothetical protein BDZ88DRAFT_416796 [Geranomyces variabilis]|nr:hypothetical protein BDZ88DRAFT_416796 [Geranomyces variabilis]KAJ3136280.1 hypothetical protein HDU90_003331 [Geranomyces variabilis]